jgi:hypothetical protein
MVSGNPSFVTGMAGLETAVATTSINSPIPAFKCPTDPGTNIVFVGGINGTAPTTNPTQLGRSNYVGVCGIDPSITAAGGPGLGNVSPLTANGVVGGMGVYQNTGTIQTGLSAYSVDVAQFGGLFGGQSSRGIRDMSDGTSNTIVVGERYTPTNTGTTPTTAQSITAIGDSVWLGATDYGLTAGSVAAQSGQAAVLGEASNGINYGATLANTFRPATTGFGSVHTGGCHFLLGDGTVRFVSANINLSTLQNLARTSDGNTVGAF